VKTRRAKWFWTHSRDGAPITAEENRDGSWSLFQSNRLLCRVENGEVAKRLAVHIAERPIETTAGVK
jgi:hypothetical protein